MKLWTPTRDRWRKPAVGQARINWSHPLARGLVGCWLFNEGAGLARDLTKNRPVSSMHSGITWDYQGLNLVTAWVTQVTVGTPPANLGAQTLCFVGNVTAPSNNPYLYYRGTNSYFYQTGASNLLVYNRDYTTTDKIAYIIFTSTNNASGRHSLVITDDGSTAADGVKAYWNGAELTYSYRGAGEGTIVDVSSETLVFGGNNGWQGELYEAFIWNRALSQAEVQQITLFPYCFLFPAGNRRAMAGAGGGPLLRPKWYYDMISRN